MVDQADLLSPAEEQALTAKLESLENQSERQFVVATVPSLQGYEIEEYGYRLGRAWGLGDAENDDGIILLVAPNERKVRIEVGYGLEGIMTDALSSIIIQNDILPRFRSGDFPGGITAGADRIITQLELPEDQARQAATDAGKQRSNDGGFPIGSLFWFAIFFFFFILPMMRGRGRKRRYRGMGDTARDIILWEVGSAIARGAMSGGDDWGGGGGGFGGFGGGGGFSGGGGSFGGGGASGGW